MKIGVDAMLLGGHFSGVEVAIEGLCEGLSEVSDPSSVVMFHRQLYTGRLRNCQNLVMQTAAGWSATKRGRILWEQLVLPQAAKRCGVDVLHAPGYVLPLRWRGPSVLTVYDMIALQHPDWCTRLNAWHYAHALPRSIRQASKVIAPSEIVKHDIIQLTGVPENKVEVIELGISPEMKPADTVELDALRTTYKLPERFILWVGNIEPKKNLEGMIKAFEIASSEIPHDFIIAGKLSLGAQKILKMIEASPVKARIHLIGFVPGEFLAALYTAADLLVHWSHYEGAGLTPVEAMCCGTPAIVSDGGALPEWAGQVAPVVPLGDPVALADKIKTLLHDESVMQELAQRGQTWAKQFTWARHARKLMSVYQEVTGLEP